MTIKHDIVRVLGIDPGTAIVGWAIVDHRHGRHPIAVAYGAITTECTKTTAQRLAEIADDLEAIIDRYSPTEMAVEQLFYFRNQTTIITVAQGRGVVLLTGARKGLTIAEYTPLQIKQAVTGYGRADKTQVQQLVRTLYGLTEIPRPDDAADALAVAFCHISSRALVAAVER